MMYRREKRRTDPVRATWSAAKHRAKARNIPFSITVEDIPPVPARCPVLDIPLSMKHKRAHANSPSLDRIVPELGYVPGNVRWLSNRANHLKSNATLDEHRRVYEDALRLSWGPS
jgi:hypothetical protein